MKLVLATRGSPLALAQAEWVKDRLQHARPGLTVELLVLQTSGDQWLNKPLSEIGNKGLFVKEIEEALLDGRAQLAVHSLKDVPRDLPEGLMLAAYPEREDPRDVLVLAKALRPPAGKPVTFDQMWSFLPQGARIGTSSLRRQVQLRRFRPDLEMVALRGNVGTRLQKLDDAALNLSAVVLAYAGIRRLRAKPEGLLEIPVELMLPAVGQGTLAIEIRSDDAQTRGIVAALHDVKTAHTAVCERAFLRKLSVDCQVPVAGFAHQHDGMLVMRGLVASLDGKHVLTAEVKGQPSAAEHLGAQVGDDLLAQGAQEILDGVEHL